MAKFTLMGFTEAELGFLLAAVFAATAASQAAHMKKASATRADSIATLRKTVQVLSDSLARIPHNAEKRSMKPPNCWERGEPNVSVAQMTIVSGSTLRFRGEIIPTIEIAKRLASYVTRSQELACRYRVDVSAEGTPPNLMRSLDLIGRYFDVRKRY